MAILDGFEMVKDGNTNAFITLRNSTITFSKSVVEDLDFAEYVHMFIDKQNHQVAFQACENDSSAIKFYVPPVPGKQVLVRVASTAKARMLMELAGISDCGKGIRFYGEYYQEERIFVVPLK